MDGKGNDVCVYECNNDIITDYAAGQDSIKLNDTISKVEYSNKNVIFKIGSDSLTVNNAKGKNITFINNSQTQIYSKTYDLLYDNNFVTDEFRIDEITEVTERNYSVGEIEKAKNTEQICNTIAAFSDEK